MDVADRFEAVLDDYAEHLALERGRSEHTRRAYLTDLRSLFTFLDSRVPGAGLDALSLPVLRGWLAARALERVTGKIGAEDVLGRVFSSFCIGK